MKRLLILGALFFALPTFAQLKRGELIVSPQGRTATTQYYRFSSETVSLKVIPKGKFPDLNSAMKAHNCIAGSNGGFFDPSYQPLGLVISDSRTSGRKNLSSSLTSGVIYQTKNSLTIERAKSFFKKSIVPEQLLQTGPFLIEKGEIIKGLSDRRYARRTFIATNDQGEWILAYTPPTTLAQLAKSLADSKETYGFQIKTALNLDGGSSSALWVKKGEKNNPFYLKERKPVANFIGLIAK